MSTLPGNHGTLISRAMGAGAINSRGFFDAGGLLKNAEAKCMDLYDLITKRKSCRNYTGRPFAKDQLARIGDVIADLTPLYPDVALEWRFVTKMKGPFKVEAPHYLIISGQGKRGEAESAGFVFQQLMLWFNLHDIGSVWLGGPQDVNQTLRVMISWRLPLENRKAQFAAAKANLSASPLRKSRIVRTTPTFRWCVLPLQD